MKSVKLHNDISAIGERAFSGCSSLSSIEIPGSVKSIGSYAFSWCPFDEITCLIEDPAAVTYGENIFTDTNYADAVLKVPAESLDKYKEVEPWKNFSNIEALPTSGIEEVSVDLDMSLPYTVYDLNGVKVSDSIESLSTVIYVVCQGKKVMKLAIK